MIKTETHNTQYNPYVLSAVCSEGKSGRLCGGLAVLRSCDQFGCMDGMCVYTVHVSLY